ncbi:MAG TPA: cysteine desulfurase family protein [Longimicrobiales bacterium]|nr:cysteine desulfurase family protein [Longimicrobiales bacterium]
MRYVYLDHAATTPLRPEVRDAMAPFFDERFGNPSSMHRWGRQARNALEEARERVAAAIGAKRREIVFTGSGTEADNIAVLGRWRSFCRTSGRAAVSNGGHHDGGSHRGGSGHHETGGSHEAGGSHETGGHHQTGGSHETGGHHETGARATAGGAVVCTAIEHKAVGAAAQCAAAEGAPLILLGVDEAGRVQLDALGEALAADPCIVSIMWANNEVGTIQPVSEIGERCREAGVTFHTDAVQAFGKVPVRVDTTPCDMLSLSAHKIGGPKGIGALYIREATTVLPLLFGGGQERELRPGTENVASAVGFATAAELAVAEREAEVARIMALRTQLEDGLRRVASDVVINGPRGGDRLPNIVNVTVPGADQEGLLIGLDLEGIAASGASACASGAVKASHVLVAMGALGPDDASVRLSIGRTTTEEEIARAVEAFGHVVAQLRIEAGF